MSVSENIQIFCIKTGPMDNNTWLVCNTEKNEGFIIDASFNGEKIAEEIKGKGISLKGILLTHGHYDHIYSVQYLKEEFASDGVAVFAGENEEEIISNPALSLFKKHGLKDEGVQVDRYIKDGEKFELAGIDLQVINTPGHTKGGVCYYILTEGILFTGDTLFAGSHGRTDLPTGNQDEIYESLTKRLFTLPKETIVCPGHGDQSDIGYESKYNPILGYK